MHVGTFRIWYWKFGPTELRILLAIGTLQLLRSPWSTIADHRVLLFDLGASIGAVAVPADVHRLGGQQHDEALSPGAAANGRGAAREPRSNANDGSGCRTQSAGFS